MFASIALFVITTGMGYFSFVAGYMSHRLKEQGFVFWFALFCLTIVLMPIFRTNIYGDPLLPTIAGAFLVGWLVGKIRHWRKW